MAPTKLLTVARYETLRHQWHPTKNGDLKPSDITIGSTRKVWWRCSAGPDHVWLSSPNTRVKSPIKGRRKIQSCPCCVGLKISVTNSLASRFPEIARQWHPTKNGDLTPADVVSHAGRSVWWKCHKGPDHEWWAAISSRTGSTKPGCPFCSSYFASVTNSLASLFPKVAAEWHPTKNGNLTPKDVPAGSNRVAWWKCGNGPDHVWRTWVHHRTRNRSGCPFCCGKKASVTNNLAALYPKIARQWHPTKNGKTRAKQVYAQSYKLAWWKCRNGPDHEWQAKIYNRTRRNNRCPFCAGKQVSVTNCLKRLYPKIAKQWHATKNGKLTPKDVMAGDKQPAWWKCPLGHVYKARISDRTLKNRGCPGCTGAIRGVGGP